MKFLSTMDRKTLTIAGIVVAVLFLFSFNILVGDEVTDTRLDLTQNKLFTLSDGTREVISQIDEPIKIRFYYSRKLGEVSPPHAIYANRVRELLENYKTTAAGKIQLQIINPDPFSVEEDDAVRFGLQGVPLDQSGELGYFGLVATNSTDDKEVIPFFDPSRERFLEYDLTRKLFDLAKPKKKTIGLITNLLIEADPMLQYKPWPVIGQINQFFSIRSLGPDVTKIPDDVDILLLIHPKLRKLSAQYAIDQFIMRGGNAVILADPYNETARMSPQLPPGAGSTNMGKLFDAWGIDFDNKHFIGDRATSVRVSANVNGRDQIGDYVSWQAMDDRSFNQDDVITAQLAAMSVASPGALGLKKGSTLKMTPLIQSSPISGKISVDVLDQGEIDPQRVLKAFKPDKNVYTYAARFTGHVKSAFPDGPPPPDKDAAKNPDDDDKDKKEPKPHLSESKGDIHLVVMADSDMVSNRFWLRQQSFFGQDIVTPVTNNVDFIINAIENLTGSQSLIGLRGRGISNRPFHKIAELRNRAEDKYRQTERSLTAKLGDLQEKLRDLKVEKGKDAKVILTSDQKKSFETFRAEMLDTRKKLRDVQHALRSDIENLDTTIKIINIWVVPVLVALVALVLALIRRRRFRQRSAH